MIQLKAFKQSVAQWNEHLRRHDGSMFLSHEWLEALKSEAGQPIYFLFTDQDNIKAMIAGLERPVGNGKRRQLFFFAGIASAGNDPLLLKQCKLLLLRYARSNSYWRVIMKSYDCMRCHNAKIKDYVAFRREEFIVDLTRELQEISQAISPEARRKIRKAARAGLAFKQGHSEELLKALFQLIDSTYQIRTRKGYGKYSPYSMPFLNQEIAMHLLKQKLAIIHYVEKGGEPLSMAFTVIVAQKAYGIWMGSSQEGYKAAAPSLLIFESIKALKANGNTYLNMGGVPLGSKNQGVRKFKLSMGATPVYSSEQTTDFLMPPLSYLNHVMKLKRVVEQWRIPWKVKKILLQGFGLILKDHDKY